MKLNGPSQRAMSTRKVNVVLKHALAGAFVAVSVGAAPALAEAPPIVGQVRTYKTKYEDTMLELARANKLGFVDIMAANPGVDPFIPGEGTPVVLPTQHLLPPGPREGIIVNLGEMRLYWFPKPGMAPETFPIGVGREAFTTPLGQTTIVRKAAGPTWRPTAATRADKPSLPAVVPPGPDNPLGAHALYLGWPTYLMHGTNQPYGVGRRVSRGCIRMYPEDIEYLYSRVPVGTKVTVIDEPIKFGWVNGQLFMEANPSKAQADQIEEDGRFYYELPGNFTKLVLAAAGDSTDRLDWDTIRQAAKDRKGFPVQITR